MKLLNHMTGGQDLKPCVFVIANEHIPKEAMTVSTTAHMGKADPVHYFTLGPATTISAETYDCPILYIGAGGSGEFLLGEQETLRLRRRGERIRVYRNLIKWRKGDFNEQFTESSGGVPLKRHDRL